MVSQPRQRVPLLVGPVVPGAWVVGQAAGELGAAAVPAVPVAVLVAVLPPAVPVVVEVAVSSAESCKVHVWWWVLAKLKTFFESRERRRKERVKILSAMPQAFLTISVQKEA